MAKLGMCKFHLSKDVSIYGIILPVMISYVGLMTSHYKDPYETTSVFFVAHFV